MSIEIARQTRSAMLHLKALTNADMTVRPRQIGHRVRADYPLSVVLESTGRCGADPDMPRQK